MQSRAPQPSSCRGCGAPIYWERTRKGRMMPVDAGTFLPHWETCTNKELFRRIKAIKETRP